MADHYSGLRKGLQRPVGGVPARAAAVCPGQHLLANHTFPVAGHADGARPKEPSGGRKCTE